LQRRAVLERQRTRGRDKMKHLNAATLALVELYHRRLDKIERDLSLYQQGVVAYKASVEQSFAGVIGTQNEICAALQRLPNQLERLIAHNLQNQPPPAPRRQRRRRRHRRRNRGTRSPPASSSSSGDEMDEENIESGDAADVPNDVATNQRSDDVAANRPSDDDDDEDTQEDPTIGVEGRGAPAAPVVAAVVPLAATAILRPPVIELNVNDVLTPGGIQPNCDTCMPASMTALLVDWRTHNLEKFLKVKGRSRLWGTKMGQAYPKREFLMKELRAACPNIPRNSTQLLTQVQKEDWVAAEFDRLRGAYNGTMTEFYDRRKAACTEVIRRQKKRPPANNTG
jgi:hypothetical protein